MNKKITAYFNGAKNDSDLRLMPGDELRLRYTQSSIGKLFSIYAGVYLFPEIHIFFLKYKMLVEFFPLIAFFSRYAYFSFFFFFPLCVLLLDVVRYTRQLFTQSSTHYPENVDRVIHYFNKNTISLCLICFQKIYFSLFFFFRYLGDMQKPWSGVGHVIKVIF